MTQGISKAEVRSMGYAWLGKIMNIPKEFKYIEMLDDAQCKQAIQACKPY